jgi:phage terminase large subunit-like protein
MSDWLTGAPTFDDIMAKCVNGRSGLVGWDPKTQARCLRTEDIEDLNKSTGLITLVNGSKIHMTTGEKPDKVRGYNLTGAWLDEFAMWRYQDQFWNEVLIPALRIGKSKIVITTTPRGSKLIRELKTRTDGSVVVTHGSIDENADNLDPDSVAEMHLRYDNTHIGRRELFGEDIEDIDGALWRQRDIDATRIRLETEDREELHKRIEKLDLTRIILAVDPAVTSGEDSDETGIVVVAKGADGRGYLLADRSCRDTPSGWAHRAVAAYEEFKCDRVVAEKNQGGDMVELTLRSVMPNISYKGITAKQGKRLRAEPIAALYEQGRISHVGNFEALEDQLVSWVPDSGYSPDRLDALVHGFAELDLAFGSAFDAFLEAGTKVCPSCNYPNLPQAKTCSGCNYQFDDDGPNDTGFPWSTP